MKFFKFFIPVAEVTAMGLRILQGDIPHSASASPPWTEWELKCIFLTLPGSFCLSGESIHIST
jgi:hypothetical protein